MEIRQGCTPHIIYRPYLDQVRDDTAGILVAITERPRPSSFFWYGGQQFAYLEPSSWYTGNVIYRQVPNDVPQA